MIAKNTRKQTPERLQYVFYALTEFTFWSQFCENPNLVAKLVAAEAVPVPSNSHRISTSHISVGRCAFVISMSRTGQLHCEETPVTFSFCTFAFCTFFLLSLQFNASMRKHQNFLHFRHYITWRQKEKRVHERKKCLRYACKILFQRQHERNHIIFTVKQLQTSYFKTTTGKMSYSSYFATDVPLLPRCAAVSLKYLDPLCENKKNAQSRPCNRWEEFHTCLPIIDGTARLEVSSIAVIR